MSDNNEKGDATVTISQRVIAKLVTLNRDAKNEVSLVGGNSVQDGYRNATVAKLDEQYQLLQVFTD